MLVISTREFRANQKSYLDKIDEGTEVLIQRSKNKCYKIVPVEENDTLMSKEDFFAKIDRSIQQAKEGKLTKQNSGESIHDFLNRLCTE